MSRGMLRGSRTACDGGFPGWADRSTIELQEIELQETAELQDTANAARRGFEFWCELC